MSKRQRANLISVVQYQASEFASCTPVTLADGITAQVGTFKSDHGETETVHVQALEFDKSKFSDGAVEHWMESHDWATAARTAHKHQLVRTEGRKFYACDYEDFMRAADEGMPVPEEKDDAESWQRASNMFVNALMERGWYIWGEGEYSFEPKAFYDDSVICVDVNSGMYYSIPYTMDGDECTLGEPVKTDVTYTPGDAPSGGSSPASEPPPVAAKTVAEPGPRAETVKMRVKNFSIPTLIRASDGSKKRSIFRILACHSGWSRDRRYFEKQCLIDAVERGVFDGVQCFYRHPDETTGERPPGVACGVTLPGRTTWQENKAGEVDVFVDVMMANTTTGADIEEMLMLTLQQEVSMIGTSVFGRAQQKKDEQRDGRIADVVYTKFHQLYALDFVDRAALPRTGAVERLAASSTDSNPSNPGVKPVMTITPEQLAAAEKRAKDSEDLAAKEKDRADKAERELDVDKMMASCPLPKVLQAPLRAQLMLEVEKDKRQAQYDMSCAVYASALPVVKAGNPGQGGAAGDDQPGLDVTGPVADEILAVAKSRGISVQDLVAAQERRKGNPVPVTAAATTKKDDPPAKS